MTQRFNGKNIFQKARILGVIAILPMGLSACMVPTGPVEVTRFHNNAPALETVNLGTIMVVPFDGSGKNILSQSPYKAAIERELTNIGYAVFPVGKDVVTQYKVKYSVERVEIDSSGSRSPISVGVGGGTGGYRSGFGVGVGINLGGSGGPSVETTLRISMVNIDDNIVFWEGTARQRAGAKSPAAQPGIAASKLASAIFMNFPGKSGETITVK
ncbi:hypothetical protein LPB140_01975 [Sphingorhabdus lutea]|uniref:DUF4136 domain-containing protein n=1 Tax=Sphingorhabdus lutea TaxID=1913578 RepID=A0A1L3J9P0_9SPHN|nr:DUF4136 domain-containing protein [Sphingorhabdus lutea]APG61803.1 hypothetical protein LPB140_01975 [Sphingorhabdus lutea]